MTSPAPAAGWYPADEHTERYWDGGAWTDQTRPRVPTVTPAAGPEQSKSPLVSAAILAAAAVGFIMAIQGASLLSGTGNLWTGVAIATGATVVAFVAKAKTSVKILALLAALVGLANTLYVEAQLSDLREDFSSSSTVERTHGGSD